MSGTVRTVIPAAATTSLGFDGLTSGTNTQAAMVVGSGASLAATGTGTITASGLNNVGLVAANEYIRVLQGNTLPIFNQKLAGVITNQNNCRILINGDSVSLGLHAGSATNQNMASNYGAFLQRIFSKQGITAQRDTMLGNGDGTTYLSDSRIVKGSSWNSGGNTLGGVNYTASTTTNALSFTPTGLVDRFKITYLTVSGAGIFSANIDGGSNSNQSTNGANGLASITLSATAPGLHTCNISYVSGGSVRIAGIEAWNSTISQVQIMVAGWGGATTPNIADSTQPYSPLGGLGFCAPDLTILALGINDWVNGTAIGTFNTAYQNLITEAKLSGDCIALIPPPSSTGQIPQATQDLYVNAIRTLAAANNIPVIDIYARFVSWTFSSALMFDNLHPNIIGQEVIGGDCFALMGNFGSGSANPPAMSIPLLIQTVANNTYTYIGYAGSAGTILGIYEEARALTTAGTLAITINGTNVTGLSAVVPTTAGSYNYATALNIFNRGDKIQIVYTGTSLVLDHTLTLDVIQPLVAL